MNIATLFNAMPGALAQGLIWAIMAIGVYLTFRILDVADLTVDGTLGLGGAVCIMCMTSGMNVWLSLLLAFGAGLLAGLVTGLFHTFMGIPAILAGILTQLSLYSVNLKIMGKANQAINVDKYDLLVSLRYIKGVPFYRNTILIVAVLMVVVIAILYWFFGTELGCSIRATGCNANIYDLPYAQVQQLDAGRWFGQKYTGTRIPTLEEVLDQCKGRIQLNIEIKPNAATPELEAETVRIIYEKGFEHDCVITSQSYDTLCKVKELAPEIQTGYILALGVGSYYDLPAADFFSVESTFITAGMVQQIHLRGKTISAWTINRQQDAEKLLQLGVDDLITDKPEIIAPLLARDKALDNRLLWLRDQIQELLAAPDAEEAMEVEETIEDAIEDPEEVLDEA